MSSTDIGILLALACCLFTLWRSTGAGGGNGAWPWNERWPKR